MPTPEEKRRREIHAAKRFRPNDRMEHLLKIRETDPAAFAKALPAGAGRIALGHYEAEKANAAKYADVELPGQLAPSTFTPSTTHHRTMPPRAPKGATITRGYES